MSHYVKIKTQIKNQEALIRALGRLGFGKSKIEVFNTKSALYGFKGDLRAEQAHVIIRKQYVGSSSNDIGFERGEDGLYVAHISEFDQGTGTYKNDHAPYGQVWQNKLKTYYGVELAKMTYEKMGIKYTEKVDEKNRPQLFATVNA